MKQPKDVKITLDFYKADTGKPYGEYKVYEGKKEIMSISFWTSQQTPDDVNDQLLTPWLKQRYENYNGDNIKVLYNEV
jgi:hypothetical protein